MRDEEEDQAYFDRETKNNTMMNDTVPTTVTSRNPNSRLKNRSQDLGETNGMAEKSMEEEEEEAPPPPPIDDGMSDQERQMMDYNEALERIKEKRMMSQKDKDDREQFRNEKIKEMERRRGKGQEEENGDDSPRRRKSIKNRSKQHQQPSSQHHHHQGHHPHHMMQQGQMNASISSSNTTCVPLSDLYEEYETEIDLEKFMKSSEEGDGEEKRKKPSIGMRIYKKEEVSIVSGNKKLILNVLLLFVIKRSLY